MTTSSLEEMATELIRNIQEIASHLDEGHLVQVVRYLDQSVTLAKQLRDEIHQEVKKQDPFLNRGVQTQNNIYLGT